MRQRFQALLLALFTAAAFSFAAIPSSFVQATTNSDATQSGVVLVRLSTPTYPRLARQTRIVGDVRLSLDIRQDGSVQSAVVISGHPLLQQAALDSAQESQFECRGCGEAATSFSLVYTFQLTEPDCSEVTNGASSSVQQDGKSKIQILQSENHVQVIGQAVFTCDPDITMRKVRSAKCLYLWKCGWHL